MIESKPTHEHCRIFSFKHDTELKLTFSLSRFRDQNFTSSICSPILVLPAECLTALDASHGEKGLVSCWLHTWPQSKRLCLTGLSETHLPAAINAQALHWWESLLCLEKRTSGCCHASASSWLFRL
ncbi:hypothetical protein GOODEAATRI_001299 [Goodea atripinnis]|uniref:Uncharacterized protein n=1 Tax=Goodea atripinnis TaxID=208336 RepID=A0ABV0PUD4_9TELE